MIKIGGIEDLLNMLSMKNAYAKSRNLSNLIGKREIIESPNPVLERKGINPLGDANQLSYLLHDLVRRGMHITPKSIKCDVVYSMFGVLKDEPEINLVNYRGKRIRLKNRDFFTTGLFDGLLHKKYDKKITELSEFLIDIVLGEGISVPFNYANQKFIEMDTKRAGANYSFVHSYRVAKRLKDKGFSDVYVHTAVLHDLVEDSIRKRESEIASLKLIHYDLKGMEKIESGKKIQDLTKILEKMPENQFIRNFYSCADFDLKYVPMFVEGLTGKIEKKSWPIKMTQSQIKIEEYKTEIDDKIGRAKGYLKTEEIRYDVELAVKLVDSYDNTDHIDELKKERKDIRLDKNLVLIEKIYAFMVENNIKNDPLKDLMMDLVNVSIVKVDAFLDYYEAQKSDKVEWDNFIVKYNGLMSSFKEYKEKMDKI